MTLQHRYRTRAPRVREFENVSFCQVATQVSFYVPCLLAQSLMPFSPGSLGPKASSGITPMPGRAPKTPMRRSTPSSGLVVGRRKLSTWRWWSQRNAPAGGFSTSIAQSSGRTGRRDLAPHPHEKSSSRHSHPQSHRKSNGGIFRAHVNFARARRARISCTRNRTVYLWICISSASRCEDGGFHEGLAKNERSRERQVWSSFHLFALQITFPTLAGTRRNRRRTVFLKNYFDFNFSRFGVNLWYYRACEIFITLNVARSRNVSILRWNCTVYLYVLLISSVILDIWARYSTRKRNAATFRRT